MLFFFASKAITRDLCPHKCVDVNLSRLTVASRPVLDNDTSLNEYVLLRDSSAAQDNDCVGLFFGSLSTWQHFGFQGLFQKKPEPTKPTEFPIMLDEAMLER